MHFLRLLAATSVRIVEVINKRRYLQRFAFRATLTFSGFSTSSSTDSFLPRRTQMSFAILQLAWQQRLKNHSSSQYDIRTLENLHFCYSVQFTDLDVRCSQLESNLSITNLRSSAFPQFRSTKGQKLNLPKLSSSTVTTCCTSNLEINRYSSCQMKIVHVPENDVTFANLSLVRITLPSDYAKILFLPVSVIISQFESHVFD